MKERVPRIRKSTVRVWVNGNALGTGFVVSDEGLVATCYHVVQDVSAIAGGQAQLTYASSIEVELDGGARLPASVHPSCQNQGFSEAVSRDYCILEVNSKILTPLPLGTFSDAYEGADIYICGFPLEVHQPITARGILSAKWDAPGYLNHGNSREAAWLDVTMNKGNSGGPVVLAGDVPEDDKVIGIATFGLNPFDNPSQDLVKMVQTFPGNVILMGVNFKEFATLVGYALMHNSLGVGGCVAVDYLESKLDAIRN